MMKKKINKKVLIISLVVVIVGIALIVIPTSDDVENGEIGRCEQALFETTVTTIGQLEATNTIDVTIPSAMSDRRTRIYELKISDLVAEGTKVKKGDFVASLDPTEVNERLKDRQERLDQYKNSYESACLDSSLQLSGYRDAIIGARDQLADSKMKVEQSQYESKAFQRQAQIAYERAQRTLEQKKRDLTSRKIRLNVGIRRIEDDIKSLELQLSKLQELKEGLTILAPADGMVIYGRNRWNGRKFKIGDEVRRQNANIASLPDLSGLVSEAFVQEVDIKDVKIGQLVRLTVDAFPDKVFTGNIVKIANIGQRIPGKKVNGFKITIKLNEYREEILPGMTSTNTIITGAWDDALIIPRPALFGGDSLKYVYLREGLSTVKQQVKTNGENETHFRILCGLSAGDKILLYEPDNSEGFELQLCE